MYLHIIGTIREKVLQPSSQEYIPMPKMNVITEEVDYAKIKEKESGPSCSLAEALDKQDLFINSTLAHIGCDLLWRMFKEGKTLYRGAYVILETLKVTAIPVYCISDRIIFPSEYGHLFYLLLIIYYVLTSLEKETLYL